MAGPTKTSNSPPAPPSLKKSTSGLQSSKNQTSIAGFFQKKTATPSISSTSKINGSVFPVRSSPSKKYKRYPAGSDQSLTPAPSSDAVEKEEEEDELKPVVANGTSKPNGLPSPITPATVINGQLLSNGRAVPAGFYSPSRKARSTFDYSVALLTDEVIGKKGRLVCRIW